VRIQQRIIRLLKNSVHANV